MRSFTGRGPAQPWVYFQLLPWITLPIESLGLLSMWYVSPIGSCLSLVAISDGPQVSSRQRRHHGEMAGEPVSSQLGDLVQSPWLLEEMGRPRNHFQFVFTSELGLDRSVQV